MKFRKVLTKSETQERERERERVVTNTHHNFTTTQSMVDAHGIQIKT